MEVISHQQAENWPLLSASLQSEGEGREDGVHLSQIIRDLNTQLRRDEIKRNEGLMTEEEVAQLSFFGEVGFCWESVFSEVFAERMLHRKKGEVVQQESVELDGIHMSPDGVELSNAQLEEYKATWRSLNKWLAPGGREKFFLPWLMQVKSYLYALEMEVVSFGVLWVCGDYKPAFPKVTTTVIAWDRDELRQNWEVILAHRDRMEKAGRLTTEARAAELKEMQRREKRGADVARVSRVVDKAFKRAAADRGND